MQKIVFFSVIWLIVSLIGFLPYQFESEYDYSKHKETGYLSVSFLPILYKNTCKIYETFNGLGKVTMCILATILYLPLIILNYIIFVPLVLIVWGILNFFFWLFTIEFSKKEKKSGTKWVSTDSKEKYR